MSNFAAAVEQLATKAELATEIDRSTTAMQADLAAAFEPLVTKAVVARLAEQIAYRSPKGRALRPSPVPPLSLVSDSADAGAITWVGLNVTPRAGARSTMRGVITLPQSRHANPFESGTSSAECHLARAAASRVRPCRQRR